MNTAGRGGETPLHAAAMGGNADSAYLLLARGADPLRKNAQGETPLDVARRGQQGQVGGGSGAGWGRIVEVLERAEAEAAAVAAATRGSVSQRGKERYRGEGEGLYR